VNGRPVRRIVLRSVHHGVAVAPNVSIGSGVVGHHHSTGPPGHVSDPLGSEQLLLSGQFAMATAEGPSLPWLLSPFGHRHSLLGHPFPAGGLGLPCGRLTGARHAPDPDGVSMLHIHELRPEWVPSKPRGRRCPMRTVVCDRSPPATLQRQSPLTPVLIPSAGACLDEASSRVHILHPPGLPLACGRLDGGGTLGLFPELHTPPLPATHVEEGTGRGH